MNLKCPFLAHNRYCFYKKQCNNQIFDYKNKTIKCGKAGDKNENSDKKRSI